MNTALIYKYCEVIRHDRIYDIEYIWYRDIDGSGVLEALDSDGEHWVYDCLTQEVFDLIISML